MLRLAIAEDHPDLRAGLVRRLAFFPEIKVVATAENGAELVAALDVLPEPPEVILMDIEMPDVDGITATAEVHRRWPETAVVMLTVFGDDTRVLDALDAGAAGYLVKETPAEQIVEALHDAARGRTPLAPEVAGAVVRHLRSSRALVRDQQQEVETLGLTPRERDVLAHLARGQTDEGTAYDLDVSVHTVRTHTKSLFRKLNVHSRAEAARRAVELGLT